MNNSTIFQQIMDPHTEKGHNVIVVQGSRKNDLFPVEVNSETRIQPGFIAFQNEAKQQGYISLEYCMASGISADLANYLKRDADLINERLNHHNMLNHRNTARPEEEFVDFARGLLNLIQDVRPLTLTEDNRNYRFIINVRFAEHLLTESQNNLVVQKVTVELIHKLAHSLSLRKSGCIILLHEERENMLNALLRNLLPAVRIPSSTSEERKQMLSSLKLKYPNYRTTLSDEEMVSLSSNMMNRTLEKVMFASSTYNAEITPQILTEEKKQDIMRQSEGTLTPIETSRLVNRLSGRNIDSVIQFLDNIAEDLKMGRQTLRNIILAGAPSTGKTALATFVAHKAGMQAFMVNTTKSGVVGESERRTDVLLNTARDFGGIFIIDEIDSLFNFDRNSSNLDSGVSASISAKFLSFFSDESLSGKCVFIGTTNRPGKLSEAMRSRFTVIPVLSPLREDMPEIISDVCAGINPESSITASDIESAAFRFYDAGASFREIREGIKSSQLILHSPLNNDVVKHSAGSVLTNLSRESYIHADLTAIKACRSASLLPFWNNETNMPDPNYPYPTYISEILDNHHYIDSYKLNMKIKELEPYANV